ncbi:MAG TPA: ABC transporter substrate-binding protein [Xanthobacteraceae bacterium]|nr:ABC transporter substrate-binding protein [Xanthobacteraceae bacterium]
MKKKKVGVWLASLKLGLAVVAASALIGEAIAQQLPKLQPLNPPRTIKLATAGQVSDAAIYIAMEKGYFKELGLNIDITVFQNAASMVAPLGSGELDVGGGAISAGLWNAEMRKLGVRAVADKGQIQKDPFSYFGLVTLKDSPIKECKDVKGKNMANGSTSNGILHAIEIWLQTCGLTLKDVNLKSMSYSDVVPALVNGAIDFGHLGDPLIAINEKNGLIRVLRRHNQLRPHEQLAVLYYSSKFIKDTDLARRFMVAYVRGLRDYQEAYKNGLPPAEWLVKIMQKHTRVKDAELYKIMQAAGLDRWGEMDLVSMRDDFEWFKKRGLIVSSEVKFEDPIDTSFLKYAKEYLTQHPNQ